MGDKIRSLIRKVTTDPVRDGLPEVYPRLWRFCIALTGSVDQAGDLAQATALRAVERSSQFKPGTHLDRWLFVMARRLWLNELRAQAVRSKGGLVAVDEINIEDTAPGVETNIFASQVLSEIARLPEAQRETVALVYIEGYRYAEAAEILEIPVGTVMSRLAAARKTLAGRLTEENKMAGE